MSIEAVIPDVFTTDYIGEPGNRSFFLQVRAGTLTRTVALEKQQVVALAEKLAELLLLMDAEDAVKTTPAARDPNLEAIPMPGEWRVGSVGIAFDEATGLFVVEIAPIEDEGEDVDEDEDEPSDVLRLALSAGNVRAFALHALAVVAEGRPECQLCGLPMDPEGHRCPATNGHHPH